MLETFIKSYSDRVYKHVTMVRHKGTVVAFAMDDARRIFYSVLDLQNTEIESPLDVNYWLENPRELFFTNEIAEVGIGVADQTTLPVVKIGSRQPEPPGVRILEDEKDLFLSSTARLSADAPFQAMSDGRHIFLFRQAITADHADMVFKRDAEGNPITDSDGNPVPLVDATLLVDRFVLSGTTLQTKMEVRFQRSRSKTRPQSRKDSLGAKDMEERPFFEPTQELRFIGGLRSGRFTALLLPTQIAGVQRWQVFAYNGRTERIDSYSIERAADGLFNTRGTQASTSTDSAESALKFAADGETYVDLGSGAQLGSKFSQEMWIYPTGASGASTSPLGQGLITTKGNANDAPPSVWIYQSRAIRAGFGDGTKWYEFNTGNLLSINAWNHVAVTFDGSAYRIFINGEQRHRANNARVYIDGVRQDEDEAFDGKQPVAAPILNFGSKEPAGSAFTGTVDEIRLWNRARGERELQGDLHQRLAGREIGLVGYWRFDEASGDTAYDHTDNGIDGVLHNGVWVTSTAPIGETGGVNRDSFRIAGRSVTTGFSALLYYLQENSRAGYADEASPLKHAARVMLCVGTNNGISTNNEIAALDFGVSGAGKLAQIPDRLDLPLVPRPTLNGCTVEEQLNLISELQQDVIGLNEDIVNLTDAIALTNTAIDIVNDALAGRNRNRRIPQGEFDELNAKIDALWAARDALSQAVSLKQQLDRALANARIRLYEHSSFRGRRLTYGLGFVGYTELNRHGFNDIISSIGIDAPVRVKVYEHANRGGKSRTISATTSWVGDDWNDIISSMDITEKPSHASARAAAAGAVSAAQAEVNRLMGELTGERDDLVTLRRAREQERSAKEQERTGKQTALQGLRGLLDNGVAVAMPLVHTAANGLSITGGILEFAWTHDTPLLFDSATGKLAMYFRGADDQFFVAYYNTLTQRANYQLVDERENRNLVCVARSTEPEYDSLAIEIIGEAEAPNCTVRITLQGASSSGMNTPLAPLKGGMKNENLEGGNRKQLAGGIAIEEIWQEVPRDLQAFARVLNGQATDRGFVGLGVIEKEQGRVERLMIDEGVRRNLDSGVTLFAGETKLSVREAVVKGATTILVDSSAVDVPAEAVPVFFIEYDYAASAQTSQVPGELFGGSRLLAVTAAAAGGKVQVGQILSSGATIASQWSAVAPGHTLAFDGDKSHASLASTDEADLKNFAAKGDLTLEAWVRPNRIDDQALIVQQRSQTSRYAMGLQQRNLETALQLNGTSQYVRIGNDAALNFSGVITIAAWIKPQANDGIRNIVAHGYRQNPDQEVFLRIIDGFYEIGSWDGANHLARFEMPAEDKTGNRWVHLAGVYDGQTWRLFRDAVEVAASDDSVGAIAVDAEWAIGARGHSIAERLFEGSIDEVRVWKRARTADEIENDMQRRLSGNEPDLVGYWHFDGGADQNPTAQDYSRHANHGEVQGDPATTTSALNGYAVFAGVGEKYVQTEGVFAAGSWAHLAAVFNQSYALKFDGNRTWLDAGKDVTLDLASDLTIEIFLQTEPANTELGLISKGRIDDGTEQAVPYALYLDRSRKLVFAFEDKEHGNHALISSQAAVSHGVFNRIAVTRKHQVVTTEQRNSQGQVIGAEVDQWDEITFYNSSGQIGAQQYRGPDAGSSSDPLEIGRCFLAGFREARFKGIISEVRVWSVAREPENIGVDITGREGGLVSWWRFEENEGNVAFDSKSSNHAKLRGNVEWVKNPEANASPLLVFVDGEPAATAQRSAGDFTTPEHQFTIGALANSAGQNPTVQNFFQGELEEVRVWQVPRTQEQIQDNLFRRLLGEKEALIAYYTFDAESLIAGLSDNSFRGNDLEVHNAIYVLSTAPIGEDTPQVRSALAGLKTPFNGLLGGRPAVQEYGDMQYDSEGNLIGVLKRCYAFVENGQWRLITGFKVGNLITEWIGQAQFAPQLIGFIEGAPPVPSENLTATGTVVGEFEDYNDASSVEIVEAQQTTYTYSAERDSGFDMMVDGKLGLIIGTEASAGFGLVVETVDVENIFGVHFNFEHSLGWLENAKTGTGLSTTKASRMGLRGRIENPDGVAYPALGRRFVPENNGFALVQSETADIFALRLQHNKALVSFYMQPNPDIPKDWNIITFPLNRQYSKQGTLDGKVGLEPDADYPNALTYSPDTSYFKPIEAYSLKNRIQREGETLKTYYDQYQAGAIGRRQAATHFSEGDLGTGRILEKLPQVHKRNLVNTFVWTADGGLFSETQATLDMQEEAVGGSYSFKGLAGIYTDLTIALFGVGFKFELDAMFGGHLNLSVTKSEASETAFNVNVDLGGVESDIFQRDEDGNIIIDDSDPLNPKPVKQPGKVDAYRFMTFYLEPRTDHFDRFFSEIVDPIWLAQSDDPSAVALREAMQASEKPACWRVLHRVTYISRILPPLDASPPPLERTMRELDIDSNYELIKLLEPFVADKLTDYAEFARAIRSTIETFQPELEPHTATIIQFMSLYYGVTDDPALMAAVEDFDGQTEGLPLAPQVDAGPAFQSVAINSEIELQGSLSAEDRAPEDFFITWSQIGGPASLVIRDPHALTTTVEIGERGVYKLRLSANDGLLAYSDDIEIIANASPLISAGDDLEILPREAAQLVGSIIDDGRADPGRGEVRVNWSLVSGPGDIDFVDEEALRTTASFNESGTYLLRLTVSNDTFEVSDDLAVAVAARVTSGLLALWVFEEGSGTLIRDVSGSEPALPLTFEENGAVNWAGGGLAIEEPAIVHANGEIAKIVAAMQASNALSIEAWVKPKIAEQPGLARIVTLSGAQGRNFTLGQRGSEFYAAVRASTTNANASNKALAGGQAVADALLHVVCTREESGLLRLFVDGNEVAARLVSGTFANWSKSFSLALGNEASGSSSGNGSSGASGNRQGASSSPPGRGQGWVSSEKNSGGMSGSAPASATGTDRAWSGVFHLVALYSRALSPQEVVQNFEFGADTNLAPLVEAGSAQTVNLPDQAELVGKILDDRLLSEQMTVKWTQAGGPTSVVFEDAETLTAKASFETSGRYVLRLTASDGLLSSSDELIVIANQAPVIDAGAAQSITPPDSAQLQGVLQSDGIGNDSLPRDITIEWSQMSGPGQATFEDAHKLDSKVNFSEYGTYVLQLSVDNGYLPPTVAEVTIYVNKAPVIRAQADAIVTLPGEATLTGEEIDLGLADPNGKVTRTWSKVSGSGEVTFVDADALSTTAQFTKSGVYVLQFALETSGDGFQLRSETEVTIIANSAPVVDAGHAQTIQLPALAELEGTVTDDGFPDPPGEVTVEWRKKSGPGEITFSDAHAAFTKARFARAGSYVLELSARDYAEAEPVTDEVAIEALPSPRVTDGLVALYSFMEQSGDTVHDISGVDTPLDLALESLSGNPDAITWLEPGLRIDKQVIFKTAANLQRLIDACKQSNEISIEAWIKRAASVAPDEAPGRIITFSVDQNRRNFMLGQTDNQRFQARLRTTLTDDNGYRLKSNNQVIAPEIVSTDEKCHLVFTHTKAGKVRLYLNGKDSDKNSRRDIGGDFDNWANAPQFQLALANELNGNRPWLGEYYLIAIYSRALSEEEVRQNYEAE